MVFHHNRQVLWKNVFCGKLPQHFIKRTPNVKRGGGSVMVWGSLPRNPEGECPDISLRAQTHKNNQKQNEIFGER